MTALVKTQPGFDAPAFLKSARRSLANVARDIGQGFFEVTHNSFALLGLALVFAVAALMARPDLRDASELQLMTWLQQRQEKALTASSAELVPEPTAVERVTASNPKDLPLQQAAVAYWLSKKYGVAPEPLSALVAQAFAIGEKDKLDPTLILAVMAIESGFNPFAQSPVGAQGLMQVMTKIHHDKYENFGGMLAAFDPVTNLRVGVKVLQDCIRRAGSVEGGLRYYVGAANLVDDGGYTSKVMAEHARLLAVVGAKRPLPAARSLPAPARMIPVLAQPAKVAPAQSIDSASGKVAMLDQS